MGVELKTAILFPCADGSRGGVCHQHQGWRGVGPKIVESAMLPKGICFLVFCVLFPFFSIFFLFRNFCPWKKVNIWGEQFFNKTDPNFHPTGRFTATKEPTNGAKNPTQSNKGLESTKFFGFKQPDFQVSCLFAGKSTS